LKSSKTFFEIAIIFFAIGVIFIATFLFLEPRLSSLDFLWKHCHTPMLALLVMLVVCGKAMDSGWRDITSYIMASFVLIGGIVGGLTALSTIVNIATGEPMDIIVNTLTATAVCGGMLEIIWAARKFTGISCKPQLKSLLTFNY